MREELYKAIREALLRVDEIAHVDLWNRHLDFLEQEVPFSLPAVFIEFMPTDWQHLDMGLFKAKQEVRLHIVAEWPGIGFLKAHGRIFGLIRDISWQLFNMQGESFKALQRVGSETNHDHEQIVDMVEIYQCVAWDSFVKDRKKELGEKP